MGSLLCNLLCDIQELLSDEKYYFLHCLIKHVKIFREYFLIWHTSRKFFFALNISGNPSFPWLCSMFISVAFAPGVNCCCNSLDFLLQICQVLFLSAIINFPLLSPSVFIHLFSNPFLLKTLFPFPFAVWTSFSRQSLYNLQVTIQFIFLHYLSDV